DEIGWNGEADADRTSRTAVDRRIDANHLALHVNQRTAGIAGIDRRIGLDEIAEVTDAAERARNGRNDAARRGLPDPERIANREHKITHLQRLGIGQWRYGKGFISVHLEDCQIQRLLLQHDLAGIFAPIRERYAHLVRTFN